MQSPHSCPHHHDTPSWHIFRVLQLFLVIGFILDSQSAPLPPFHPSKLQHYLRSRCSSIPSAKQSASLWAFEGQLVDPSSNRIIADVEGLEIVRILSECYPIDDKANRTSVWRTLRGLRRLGDLKVRRVLSSNSESNSSWDYAGTLLSRKIFCYRLPGSTELLKEYRIQPTSPKRTVKTKQAVALYDTATTFVSRKGGEQMEIITEWPDGRWVQSTASSVLPAGLLRNDSEDKDNGKGDDIAVPFEFTTFTKQNPIGKNPSLKEQQSNKALPRKLIQFGKDKDAEYRRYGARENYSYTVGDSLKLENSNIKKASKNFLSNLRRQKKENNIISEKRVDYPYSTGSSMRYSRFGEAPPWYVPGRMCTLEMFGRRIDSMMDAPQLVANLTSTRVPDFMTVHAAIPIGPSDLDGTTKKKWKDKFRPKRKRGIEDKTSIVKQQEAADIEAIKAVDCFRGRAGASSLKIEDDDQEFIGQKKLRPSVRSAIEKLINEGGGLAHRVRAASKILPNSEE